jgi:hypothetical protein
VAVSDSIAPGPQPPEPGGIVHVVGRYLTLRALSDHDLCGLCPFCGSTAFRVRSAFGTFHCFGCGEGGDARPVLEFDMVDKRFIEETDVLSGLDKRPNLMDLTPTEFESLIQNLFTKMGLDTKQTSYHIGVRPGELPVRRERRPRSQDRHAGQGVAGRTQRGMGLSSRHTTWNCSTTTPLLFPVRDVYAARLIRPQAKTLGRITAVLTLSVDRGGRAQ